MTEDAQRELEQRALRNVRGLVDRMESDEALSRKKQVRLVVALVAFAAIILVAIMLGFAQRPKDGPPVDLKAMKAPEARPQGDRKP